MNQSLIVQSQRGTFYGSSGTSGVALLIFYNNAFFSTIVQWKEFRADHFKTDNTILQRHSFLTQFLQDMAQP